MDKILSQEEIDALLSNVSKPEAGDASLSGGPSIFHAYDFKHPNRISKEQIRSLRTIHENFARVSATYLSTFLRSMVDVNLLTIDQVTYSEYTQAFSVPTSIYVLQSEGLAGKIILEISPVLLLFMVDRLLGGTGETQLEPREITLIEQNVVRPMVNRMMDILNEVWGQELDVRCSYSSFEADPQFVQIARSSETIMIVFLEVKIKGLIYMMNIGIPYFLLEPILPKLTTQAVISSSKRKGEEDRVMLRQTLHATRVPVVAQLARARVTIRDFLSFQCNDVIRLPQKVEEELPIIIGGKVKFTALPGKSGRHKALRISQVVSPLERIFHQ